MSTENLEAFMGWVADSEELQAKIGEEIDAEALIALGAECGCEFTAGELQEFARWIARWNKNAAPSSNLYPIFRYTGTTRLSFDFSVCRLLNDYISEVREEMIQDSKWSGALQSWYDGRGKVIKR